MKQILRIFFFLSLLIHGLNAQVIRPEQDCINAIPVCSKEIYIPYIAPGIGFIAEIDSVSQIYCIYKEKNSAWLKLTVDTSGWLGFNAQPCYFGTTILRPEVDLDFAVFDLTNNLCENIWWDPNLSVSCNYRGSVFPTPVTGPNNGPNPQDEPMIWAEAGHTYYILINTFTFSISTGHSILIDFSIGTASFCGVDGVRTVSGYAFLDENANCKADEGESPIRNQVIYLQSQEANNISYSGTTDAQGRFMLVAPDSGSVDILFSNPNLTQGTCNTILDSISIHDRHNISNVIFPVVSKVNCTKIALQNTIPGLLRGTVQQRHIRICNEGTLRLDSANVQLEYDPHLTPVYGPDGFEQISENHYQLSIRDLAPFACKTYIIGDSIHQSTELGEQACVAASLTGIDTCTTNPEQVVNLQVSFLCDTAKRIYLKNIGPGNMDAPLLLRVMGSETPAHFYLTQLMAGEDTTYYISENEAPAYVVFLNEQSVIFSTPLQDCGELPPTRVFNDVFYSHQRLSDDRVSCENIVGSYDPNDKTGYPSGLGEEHFIVAKQSIKYRIRFQNTGNAPAFHVSIRDELPPQLDENSVIPGISDFPYVFSRVGRNLLFEFHDINLPSESHDPEGSKGFVEFYVNQRNNNPENYQISNHAAIYFDRNDPIITEPFIYHIPPPEIDAPLPVPIPASNHVYPNPAEEFVNISFQSEINNMQLFDISGRIIGSYQVSATQYQLNLTAVSSGIYYLKINFSDGSHKTYRVITSKIN